MQRKFVTFVCQGVSSTVPDDPGLRNLRHKLGNVADGRPSGLPPRLDLLLLYYELIRQVETARKKLAEMQTGRASVDALSDKFVAEAPVDFWWVHFIRIDQLTIEALTTGSVEAASQMILALAFEVSEEAIRSRLFRPK